MKTKTILGGLQRTGGVGAGQMTSEALRASAAARANAAARASAAGGSREATQQAPNSLRKVTRAKNRPQRANLCRN